MTPTANNLGWRDLTHQMDPDMPYPSFFPAPEFKQISEANGSTDPAVTQFTLCSHMGTHVDTAAHFVPGGRVLADYPIDRFMVDALVWNVQRGPLEEIGVADLEAAGPLLNPGDGLLLSTGWDAKWGTQAYREHPFLSEDAAEWMLHHEVSIVGLDLMTPDRPVGARPEGFAFPVHHLLLGADVLIVENLTALGQFDGKRVEFQSLPIRIPAEDGAPVRAVARELDN